MGKRKGYKPFPTWRRGEVGVINSFLLVEGRKGYKPFPTFGVGKGRVTNPSLLLVVFWGLLGCVFMIQWDKKSYFFLMNFIRRRFLAICLAFNSFFLPLNGLSPLLYSIFKGVLVSFNALMKKFFK